MVSTMSETCALHAAQLIPPRLASLFAPSAIVEDDFHFDNREIRDRDLVQMTPCYFGEMAMLDANHGEILGLD